MPLPTFTPGNDAVAEDIQEIVNHLQGMEGGADAYHFRASSGNDFVVTLSEGGSMVVRNPDGTEVVAVDSAGVLTTTSFAPASLTVPNDPMPSQVAEGAMVWNPNKDELSVGTGEGRVELTPAPHPLATLIALP